MADPDREDKVGRAHRCRNEDGERRLRGVGDRRDRIRGEDRERQELRQQPVPELARCQGPPDQRSFRGDDRLRKARLVRRGQGQGLFSVRYRPHPEEA